MNAHVEPGCISCGLCVSLCPSVFRFGADNTAEVYAYTITDSNRPEVQAAADSCPVSVIIVEP